MDPVEYDVFISYARKDNTGGWVSGLRDAIYQDFREFSAEPFRIFFDTSEIHSHQDWQLRLRQGLVTSRVLLVCLSPNYLRSPYCRWEWEEFARVQSRRVGGGDPVTGVYFVDFGGNELYDAAIAEWRDEVEKAQFEKLQPWFPAGVAALQEAEVLELVKKLGQGVHEQLSQAQLAKAAPGNLRRHNPGFVGRVEEMRKLRHALTASSVGVVTAVHGIGGMGKTELAVTYAHAYAHTYQGGTWQVDADGQTDILEAVSTLAFSPELGISVSDEQLKDRTWLGRRVLARLKELTETATDQARTDDPDAGAAGCLLLLDNVSEPVMLAESQLAVLPDQSWFHLIVTTRVGLDDVGAAGTLASVAMIEVGRLDDDDALALIREHQPARDTARLQPDFSSAVEEEAAENIVDLLDGYTLAVEQAAVYLGTPGKEPTRLLDVLREHGTALLDEFGSAPEGVQAIRHKERLAAVIVDQTLQRLPARARDSLAVASLLPPDTVPWEWLEVLTDPPDKPVSPRLPGLSSGDDWSPTRRMLEGRRLLTPADDRRFARLHRVLGAHLRRRLTNADTEERLDTLVQDTAKELLEITTPDTTLLAITATTITNRLTDGRDHLASADLAAAGLSIIEQVRSRLDLATTHALATATLTAYQRRVDSDPHNTDWPRDLSVSLKKVGDVLVLRGDTAGALQHYTDALQINDGLIVTDPNQPDWQRDLSGSLNKVGEVLELRGDTDGALEHYTRALRIADRLNGADPHNTGWRNDLSVSLMNVGDVLAPRADPDVALDHYTRAVRLREQLTQADPHNAGWQRDLAFSIGRVGNMLAQRGDADGARQRYTQAVKIFERLNLADPHHTEWQRGLAFSIAKVGEMLARLKDPDGALSHYIRSLHLRERLNEADPHHAGWQRELSVSLNQMGDVLASRADPEGAMDRYTRALRLRESLNKADPDNSGGQRDLSLSLDRVGKMLARDDPDGALQHYIRALHLRERLTETDPHNTEWQRELSGSLIRVGEALAARDDTADALDHYIRSLHINERLAASDPHNTEWQRELSGSLIRVGEALAARGDTAGAVDHYTRSLQIVERLAASDPHDTEWHHLSVNLQRALSGSLESIDGAAVPAPPGDTVHFDEPTLEAPHALWADDLARLSPPRASVGDDVDVSVFAPSRVANGEPFPVQVLAHLPHGAIDAGEAARAADPDTSLRGARSLAVPVALNTPLTIELSLPGLELIEVAQQLRWAGRTEGVQFEVRVPEAFNRTSVIGTVTVSRSGIPIGHLKWKLAVDASSGSGSSDVAAQGQEVARYRRAFISYATRDRPEVLRRVQLLRTLGVGYFQDVLDLKPGERWERELYRQIEDCDLFLLFWSRTAKRSKWVRREAEAALALSKSRGELGGPALYPVLIDGPPVPQPWPELAHLHFNDQLLYLMR
jgi:tetratricopeptide (TPR) repeat protein